MCIRSPIDILPNQISQSIDIMRGIACLGVIWGHAISSDTSLRLGGLPCFINGAFWVWVFFSISGYLIAKSFLQHHYSLTISGYRNFAFNRALRILPLSYVAVAIGLTVFLFTKGQIPNTVILQFLFIPPMNDMSLSGPLWSVATELQFYLFSILIIPLMIYRKIFLFFLFFLIAYFFSGWWAGFIGDNSDQPRTLFGNLGLFMFGFMLAYIRPIKIKYALFFKGILILGLIVLVWGLQNLIYGGSVGEFLAKYSIPGNFWGWGSLNQFLAKYDVRLPMGLGAIVSMLIVLVLVLFDGEDDCPTLTRLFLFFKWCGFYCYGIYVWHSILAMLNGQIFHFAPGVGSLALLSFSIVIAPFSYKFFESYFLKYKISSQR